jgi:hypothetical protein
MIAAGECGWQAEVTEELPNAARQPDPRGFN